MGFFDTITNFVLGSERVKASKADCKQKKENAKKNYDEIMQNIEAECEASLTEAKKADAATAPPTTVAQPPTTVGGKKGGKSKKRSKSNRKKTTRKY